MLKKTEAEIQLEAMIQGENLNRTSINFPSYSPTFAFVNLSSFASLVNLLT